MACPRVAASGERASGAGKAVPEESGVCVRPRRPGRGRLAVMRAVSLLLLAGLCGCGSPGWDATFSGTAVRTNSSHGCDPISATRSTPAVTVTFPNSGTGSRTVHIVAQGGGSCDMTIDGSDYNVSFVSDAIPCASLLAPVQPTTGQATIEGGDSPTHIVFAWSYLGPGCSVSDDYTLHGQ